MAGYIKVKVEKLPTQFINTKIDAEIFEEFQKRCKEQNIPMNVVIETFCRQYANCRYVLDDENIMKWREVNGETSTLNTPINKTVYYQFKDRVKSNGYFMKYVLTAFIEEYAKGEMFMEFPNGLHHKRG